MNASRWSFGARAKAPNSRRFNASAKRDAVILEIPFHWPPTARKIK
jgi:hypothetical protein